MTPFVRGEIRGAFGTIPAAGQPGTGWTARVLTLLAILGPGLIVMVGDNDAGAFSIYAEAGQNTGTSLLWTLALLVPVLYVNQEMVLRLGSVTGVGHARLILQRYGRFWGMFSVIDLLVLNALTLVTEFVGISLGLAYLGMPKIGGVVCAALVLIGAAGTGDFRRFERFAMALVAGSLLLVPLLVIVHPPVSQIAHDFVVPQLPMSARPADVLLLIIGIVGTTIAPWQLFFQQSYVIDKRISVTFLRYERIDLWLGIVLVVLGAVALIAAVAHGLSGTPLAGTFTDAGAVATGLGKYCGHLSGTLFALALIDASIIGAAAISLSTAYAVGDVMALQHSLHTRPRDAKAFYAVYGLLIGAAALLVLIPGVPLGLLTNAVQALAGVLLPGATVFLLLLCNDRDILGPWVNGRFTNAFAVLIVIALILLSLVLTAAVLHPTITVRQIAVLLLCSVAVAALAVSLYLWQSRQSDCTDLCESLPDLSRDHWRMVPVENLGPAPVSGATRLGIGALRVYLAIAVMMVVIKVVQTAM